MGKELTSPPDTSESIANKFFNPTGAEESQEDKPEAEEELEEDQSDIEEDDEELADDEADDDAEEEDEPESMTVYGTEITQDEFKTMQDQQLMHADYTKKTQAIAGQRKQTEALNSDLSASIAELEALIVNEESSEELEALLADGDTAEYLLRTNAIKAKKVQLEAAKGKKTEALNTIQAEENEKLISVMTNWAHPKTGAAAQKADIESALAYAGEIGLTTAELEKIADHKIMRSLIDAGKYSKLKKSKPGTAKRKTVASKKVSGKKGSKAKAKSPVELFYGTK